MIKVKEKYQKEFADSNLAVVCYNAEEVQAIMDYRVEHLGGSLFCTYSTAGGVLCVYSSCLREDNEISLTKIDYTDFIETTARKDLTEFLHTKEVTQTIVPCHICNKEHPIDSNKYFTVYGDINLGNEGGIVGGNFDAEGRLFRSQSFCRSCLVDFLKEQR